LHVTLANPGKKDALCWVNGILRPAVDISKSRWMVDMRPGNNVIEIGGSAFGGNIVYQRLSLFVHCE